jgi:hypothetical protein
MRRPALLAILAGTAVVVAAALAWWRPFLTEQRNFATTVPQPAPLFSVPLIPLAGGEQTCFEPAVIDTHSRRAGFVVRAQDSRAAPLALTMTGPGYRFSARVPGKHPDNSVVIVPVPAPRRDTAVRICIENAGHGTVSLWGANDRTRTPVTNTGAAAKAGANVVFSFYEAHNGTLLGHLPVALRRMSAFRPAFVAPWLLWPLAFICALGIPAGALWALWRSIRDEEDDAPAREPDADVADRTPERTWDRASAT